MEPERIDAGVKSVRFALDIFELVAFSGEAMGVTQIANRVRLTKGSAHRHLTTLVECGYLTQNPLTSRYEIGPKTQLLARVAPEFDLAKLSEGPMLELRDETGQSVVLSAMTPRGALVVRTIGGMSPIEIGVRPGSELAFHASAQGKILLAHAPRPMQKRVLESALSVWTDRTATEIEAVEEELSRVLQRGYASAPEETMLGINALAAPIFDGTDACVASVALVGSIQFLPAVPDASVVSKLVACGQDISRRLGFRASLRSTHNG